MFSTRGSEMQPYIIIIIIINKQILFTYSYMGECYQGRLLV